MNRKMQKPFVSVWMLTYNHEKFIAQAIESVLMQKTTFEFLLHIGEDYSTDNTRGICIEYKNIFPTKIDLFLNPKNNIIKNSNRIYNVCINSGAKYIAMIEGDDYWLDPYKLQKQVDFLENNPQVAGCFHNSTVVDHDNNIISEKYFKYSGNSVYTQEECLKTLTSNYSTAALVFRVSALKENIRRYLKNSSDFMLDIFITEYGTLNYIDETMSAYRIHQNGIWQGNSNVNNLIKQFKRYKFLYDQKKFRNIYKNFLKEKMGDFSWKILTQLNRINYKKRIRFSYFFIRYSKQKTKHHINYVIGKLLPKFLFNLVK